MKNLCSSARQLFAHDTGVSFTTGHCRVAATTDSSYNPKTRLCNIALLDNFDPPECYSILVKGRVYSSPGPAVQGGLLNISQGARL